MTLINRGPHEGPSRFVSLTEENYKAFPKLKAIVEKFGGKALERLYKHIAGDRTASALLSTQDKRDYASRAQLEHWKQLFAGKFDERQVERSEHIGRVHARVGLTPDFYIGGYALVLEELIHRSMRRGFFTRMSGRRTGNLIGTLVKAGLLDMDAALSAYFKAEEEARKKVIDSLGQALSGVADGDLRTDLRDLPDTYRQIQTDFHRMRHEISSILRDMADAAENIETGSGEISSAANDLANRTERTAEGITRTADVMRGVTGAVLETASAVREINGSITEISGQAEQGGAIVTSAIAAMDKIKASSDEIAQITEVIESIAFQTNLLALNAGVEAARAGEAGKGFAVVASEVGALAHRTTESAKSIKALIGKSSADVNEGHELVGRTRAALEQIIQKIGGAKVQAGEIAVQAEAQAHNLQEVSSEIQKMDSSTQQNAAMVEQSNAASRALSAESERLTAIVARFQLEQRATLRDAKTGPRTVTSTWGGAIRAANAR